MVQTHLACKKGLDIRLPNRNSRATQIAPGNPQRQLPYFDAFEPVHHDRMPGEPDATAFDNVVHAPLVRERTRGRGRRLHDSKLVV